VRDLVDLARQERAELAALLRSLTPSQWEAPSLCAGWRVHDVVAHVLSYEELGPAGLARRFARGRLGIDRTNAVGLGDYGNRSPAELMDLLERHQTPSGLTAGFGNRIALVDGMIHQQDIRRPLGLPRVIPAERLRPALEFARTAPTIGALWRTRGLRLVATDVGWAAGRGPEVRGPGEAVLMSMAGRRGVVGELTGEGQPVLSRRIPVD
jgi:uncharacterized protein (TIGR03083 family)